MVEKTKTTSKPKYLNYRDYLKDRPAHNDSLFKKYGMPPLAKTPEIKVEIIIEGIKVA